MNPKLQPFAVRPLATGDGKPTQINEHQRAFDPRSHEHEPHAMAVRGSSPQQGRAQ